MDTGRLKPSIGVIMANAVGSLMLAGGVAGLFVPDISKFAPALADRPTAWLLIAVGVAIEIGTSIALIRQARNRK